VVLNNEMNVPTKSMIKKIILKPPKKRRTLVRVRKSKVRIRESVNQGYEFTDLHTCTDP